MTIGAIAISGALLYASLTRENACENAFYPCIFLLPLSLPLEAVVLFQPSSTTRYIKYFLFNVLPNIIF